MRKPVIFMMSFIMACNTSYYPVMAKDKGQAAEYAVTNHYTIQEILDQNKFNTLRGHGFAAEKANNLIDKVKGKDATVVGDNNVKNGPDRKIINRDGTVTWIQDKYCKSATESVNAAFEDGSYRYIDGDGNVMQLEVPSDQYKEAVALMKEKISKGEVPGVDDPAQAENIVRKGNITYKQAQNICKAGTAESLVYDAKTGAISAVGVMGISTAVNYTLYRMDGVPRKEALKNAAQGSVKPGAQAFLITVLSSQATKAGATKLFQPTSKAIVKALGPKAAKAIAKSAGKEVTGEAATEAASKIVSSNMVFTAVTVVVLSAGDVKNLFQGRISAEQFAINLSTIFVATATGTAGGIAGGVVGNALVPGFGTVPGKIIGSVAGFAAGDVASKAVVKKYFKEDSEEMYQIISDQFQQNCEDYLITEKEADKITAKLQKKLDDDTLKDMYASKNREKFAQKLMKPIFEKQVAKRDKVDAPTAQEMREALMAETNEVIYIH